MLLSDEQKAMLDGAYGETVRRLMRLLARLGEIYGAERMLKVESAQISGVSYKSLGEPGLDFLRDVAACGARVKAITSMNPAGMDLEDWRSHGIPEDFANKQQQVIEALCRLGVAPSATCTPYFTGNLPRYSQHLAWAESSAVAFANSVIGARTNREGGPSALAAALCGCTPGYGLHLEENRRPTMAVDVLTELRSSADFSALGYYVGERVKAGIPYFRGVKSARIDELKALGAAMAASGSVALYHIHEITPEARLLATARLDSIAVGRREIDEVYSRLNTAERPDLVVIGCPHASLREIVAVARKLQNKRVKKPLWVCTSRSLKQSANAMGLTRIIEQAGGQLVADTCMVVSPIEEMGFQATGVNSAKAAHYLPSFCRQKVMFRETDELIKGVIE
ncbi:MAG: aconitase X catalytic domain-containing protein [Deltaproteobacteria bacterium]|nr:aconitase X catalytic domain-containing protein [Deltaproteobacteria bacterium]